MARFERALETGDPRRIVPAALELPRPIHLSHAVRVLLAMRDAGDVEKYPESAARFGAQVIRKRRLSLTDSQLLYSALAGLGSAQPRAAATSLEALLRAHDEGLAASYVQKWLERSPAKLQPPR
jgi:hypothetical protein